VLFTSVYSGVTQNTDMTKGVVDRFRSLPIWPAAPIIGAVLGDAVRYVLAGGVVLVLGLILGFDLEGGVLGAVAGIALVVVFSFGLSWVFTTLGLILRAPMAVMNAGFMGLFPLIFLSNIFVEPETLPSALEWFVGVNPVSLLVTAERGLLEGTASTEDVLVVIAIAAGITAVFAPITAKLYRSRG
jgi:ABC-2 type transport system permease protein